MSEAVSKNNSDGGVTQTESATHVLRGVNPYVLTHKVVDQIERVDMSVCR